MKKFLLVASGILLISSSVFAQDSNFDKKFRFGLRVAPQPTWLSSNDNNTSKSGAGFGFGFGLVTEFKLSDIIHLHTGIGGDFENAKVSYRQDILNGYTPMYTLNSSDELRTPDDADKNPNASDKTYLLRSRKVKTTYVTIPITLKMLTNEMSGLRYFGMFGGELGFRVKNKADDEVTDLSNMSQTTKNNIDIGVDSQPVPIRFGLNVGAGAEYRIAGSTSLFLSVNYFRGFTNLMRKESKYVITGLDGSGNYSKLKQGLFSNAVRINIGVLF